MKLLASSNVVRSVMALAVLGAAATAWSGSGPIRPRRPAPPRDAAQQATSGSSSRGKASRPALQEEDDAAPPRAHAAKTKRQKVVQVVHQETEPNPDADLSAEGSEEKSETPYKPVEIGNEMEGLERVEVIPPAQERLIDLPTALQLAEAENPTIALGRQAIVEAVALQLGARALLLPTLNAGTNYHLHQGNLQTSFGRIQDINEQSIYFGAGARTLAAETVAIPGVRIFSHLGDAMFAPLAAGQMVATRSSDAVAIENSMLMMVVHAYLDLAVAESVLDALHEGEDSMREIVQATAAFARTGQGREGDYNRARSDALLLHAQEQRTQEALAVASAQLSRVLHLDPTIRLRTQPGTLGMVQLVDPSYGMAQLIEMAQAARPELLARSAEIAAADYRVRQEATRPFLPLISVGFSGGAFGGGGNRQDLGGGGTPIWQTLGGRTDFDVMAVWSMQNLGVGNMAVTRQRRAERDQIVSTRALFANRVAREVGDAYARSEAWRRQVDVARTRLVSAIKGAREEVDRTRGGEGFPIEAIDSVNLLAESGRALVEALGNYNLAQFELFVAIGQTPNVALPDPRTAPPLPAGDVNLLPGAGIPDADEPMDRAEPE